MTTLVHILMILFGFITFVIVKNKRYKENGENNDYIKIST